MASSVTELILKFRGDSGDLKSTMAQVRADIKETANTQTAASQKTKAEINDSIRILAQASTGQIQFSSSANIANASTLRLGKSIADISTKSGQTVPAVQAFVQSFVRLGTQAERDSAAVKFFGAALAQKLIPQLNAVTNVAKTAAASTIPLGTNLQTITNIMRTLGSSIGVLQGPLNGISGRFTALGTLARSSGQDLDGVAVAAAGTGRGIAALAGPIGIAIVAVAALTAGTGLLLKGLFDLAKQAASFRGRMFDLAQQTGVAVETLSTLEIITATTGGNIDSIAQSLVIFQGKLDEAQDASSKAGEQFHRLGISTNNTEDAFRDALKVLAAMPVGFQQTNEAAELFGRRGGKQVLALLKEMGGDLDGTTAKLREMGLIISTEDARAADQFNDQLAILQFQMRALLGKEVIPAALDALQDLSKLLKDNKAALTTLGQAIGSFANLVGGLLAASLSDISLRIAQVNAALELQAELWERIARARGLIPATVFDAATGGVTSPSAGLEVTGGAGPPDDLSALKAASEEAKRLAADRIAATERAFKLGELTRRQETENIIVQLQIRAEAEKAALNDEINRKLKELELVKDSADKRAAVLTAISNLEQQVKTIDSGFEREAANKRVDLQVQERKDLLEHEQNKRDILISAGLARIAIVESEVRAGIQTALQGNSEIEKIEAETFKVRRAFLDKQLELAGKEPAERQKILDLINALEQEKTTVLQQQVERRKELERDAANHSIDLLLSNLDTIVRLGQISDAAQIASLQALARLRVRTEEQTAKDVLAIRLAAIDRETEAVNARLAAATALTDPLARAREEAELNNQLKILAAERTAIQDQGNRDVETGRQEDLDNEREYAFELLSIRRRIVDIQRETARTAVALLVLRRAPQKDIITAQANLEIKAEEDRHTRAVASLNARKLENVESNRTFAEQAEQQAELNREREAEEERHNSELLRLRIERDEALRMAGPEGGFFSGLATGQLAEFENGIKSFADAAVVAFSAVGAAINGLAQGFGQLLQSWVLMGSQADINMRKMVASVLAGVAAQSAVLAVFELAKGFAALFFNPAEAAAHFKAAALFGSIAFVTAVAGRAAAGSEFQSTNSEGAKGSSGSPESPTVEPKTVILNRRTAGQPIQGDATLTLRVPHGWFEEAFRKDYDLNGFSRLVITTGR